MVWGVNLLLMDAKLAILGGRLGSLGEGFGLTWEAFGVPWGVSWTILKLLGPLRHALGGLFRSRRSWKPFCIARAVFFRRFVLFFRPRCGWFFVRVAIDFPFVFP